VRLKQLAVVFFALAFLVALHQYLNWEVWFELKDVHHELFIVTFAFAGFLLLWLSERRRRG
jgi:hypothetical protein